VASRDRHDNVNPLGRCWEGLRGGPAQPDPPRDRLVLLDAGRARVVGRAWAGRVTTTSFADQSVTYGLATRDELEDITEPDPVSRTPDLR
jgi:hypothetical protein